MADTLPDSHKDLLEKPLVVTLATVSAEGKPSATPVWRIFDGEHILVSVDYASRKNRNVQVNRNVSLVAIDPENVYRYLAIEGVVESATEEGALETLDRLTQFYMGKPVYFGNVEPIELLATYHGILIKIKPTRFIKGG